MESFLTHIVLALSSIFTTPIVSPTDTFPIQLTTPLADDCAGYTISQEFSSSHQGVDYARSSSCTIVAAADGIVSYAGWGTDGEGYVVKITHADGVTTEYHHGDGTLYVKIKDAVKQGQQIMKMGATGYATGIHLHFEVIRNGMVVDPMSVM